MELIGKKMHKSVVTNLEIHPDCIMVWLQLDQDLAVFTDEHMKDVYEFRQTLLKNKLPEKYPFLSKITDPSTIEKGTLCLAKDKQGVFFRVRIIRWDPSEKKFQVSYIDRGFTKNLPAEVLQTVNKNVTFLDLPDACTLFYVEGVDNPRNGGWKAELVEEIVKFTRFREMDFFHVTPWDRETADPTKKYFVQLFYERKSLNIYVRRAALQIAKRQHGKVREMRKLTALQGKLDLNKDNDGPAKGTATATTC